ncbi:hypothetical protein CDCA_CDCA11G3269 [Cyanidium caldarium]|uniref:Uncharacterized protein n=1 Tax=Cyanidium caldarium TaxID=2771 RepID=A0AAV9IYS7_CYACA|nr:hypothetical protein CDCA_CDCA11G3269 [Cyanidium caldarium]
METVQQRRCRDAPDTTLYQLAQAWCWGAVKSLPHNADAMRLDLTAEQVPLADPYLWRALGECLYAVGQRDAASVAYVVEVDVSGQQLSNQDATWLLWSLHALPARWPRALRLAYTGITAFGALEGASATDDIPEPPSVSRTHRGVHALVLDGCPLRSLGRAAPAHLFATVRVLHLANTAVQSMWTLADDLEHLGMPVQHLWLVPASAERQAPPMWPNARTVGTNAEPDVQQLIRRHRRGHLDTSLNGGADPRWNGPSTAERHGPSRDTSAAIVDNMLPLSHDTVGESLITAWSLLESYARRAPSPLLQEPLLDVFLAGRVRTLQTVDGRRLSHGHRVLHALCCERHAHDCSERMLQQHRVAETLSARETGAFGCIGPAAPLTWAHAFEAARVRQASTQPAAVLVFPAAGRARQFEYHPTIVGRLAVGTLDGTVELVNTHRLGVCLSRVSVSNAAASSSITSSQRPAHHHDVAVLGLCWLRGHPDYLLSGTDRGDIRLLRFSSDSAVRPSVAATYPEFRHLTSLHANATDQHLIVSGYRKSVPVYNIRTGQSVRTLHPCHDKHINVVKFAHTLPDVLATCSLDGGVALWDLRQPLPVYRVQMARGNVMLCFSGDDRRLLVSGEDNQVVQLETASGRRLHELIVRSGRATANYTRSYYLDASGDEYIISGSCEESKVRLFRAMNGKQLGEVEMDRVRAAMPIAPPLTLSSSGAGAYARPLQHAYVQSLRPNPHRPFSFSAVLAYYQVNVCSEVVEVDLMQPPPS